MTNTMTNRRSLAAWLSATEMQLNNLRASGRSSEAVYREASNRYAQLCEMLPSGSGIDAGTTVESISDGAIVLRCSFHHMNEHGGYDGWTEHKIIARSGFYLGVTVAVTGRDRNQIKDYLAEVYRYALSRDVEWSEDTQRFVEVK